MKKNHVLLILFMVLKTLDLSSQSLPPLGTLPMYYNGGFAGETGAPRLSVGTVFVSDNNSFENNNGISYNSSFDSFIPAIRSGIGITAGYRNGNYEYAYYPRNSWTRITAINTDQSFVSLAVSPKFSFKGKYTLAPFLDASYGSSNWTYLDNSLNRPTKKEWSMETRAGILVNSQKFYVGLSFGIINRGKNDDRELMLGNQKSFSSTAQLGYSFQKNPESKFSFTPQIAFAYSDGDYLLDGSLMFRYSKVIWGFNRNGVAIGYQNKNIKIMVSQFAAAHYYLGSISLRYLFNSSSGLFN